MNAAEITDKLGLHSLRQRAWVSLCDSLCMCLLCRLYTNSCCSTSSRPAPLLVMACTRVLTGSTTLSRRLALPECCTVSQNMLSLSLSFLGLSPGTIIDPRPLTTFIITFIFCFTGTSGVCVRAIDHVWQDRNKQQTKKRILIYECVCRNCACCD